MENTELIKALKEDAEWAHGNEWETPITLGDHLDAAADALERLTAERDAAIADLNHLTYAGPRCEICKHYLDENCITCEFEWRGPEAEKGDALNE